MIDYIPSAYIEYTDVMPLATGDGYGGGGGGGIGEDGERVEIYPKTIQPEFVHFQYDTSTNPSYYAIECPYSDLPADDLPHFQPPGFTNPFGSGSYTYYWIRALTDSSGNLLTDEVDYYVLYRAVVTAGLTMEYELVSPEYTLDQPPAMPSVEGGSGVFWLYNLGSKIFNAGYNLDYILGFGVGSYNFLYLLLSGGFLVYMGWCIVKFIF